MADQKLHQWGIWITLANVNGGQWKTCNVYQDYMTPRLQPEEYMKTKTLKNLLVKLIIIGMSSQTITIKQQWMSLEKTTSDGVILNETKRLIDWLIDCY